MAKKVSDEASCQIASFEQVMITILRTCIGRAWRGANQFGGMYVRSHSPRRRGDKGLVMNLACLLTEAERGGAAVA